MPLNYDKAKKDSNHDEIKSIFVAHGYSVVDTYTMKCGFDFIAWSNSKGRTFIVEVKDINLPPSRTKLTTTEKSAQKKYGLDYYVVYSVIQAGLIIKNDMTRKTSDENKNGRHNFGNVLGMGASYGERDFERNGVLD